MNVSGSRFSQICQCDHHDAGSLCILYGAFLRQLSQPANQSIHVGDQERHQAGPQWGGAKDPAGSWFFPFSSSDFMVHGSSLL